MLSGLCKVCRDADLRRVRSCVFKLHFCPFICKMGQTPRIRQSPYMTDVHAGVSRPRAADGGDAAGPTVAGAAAAAGGAGGVSLCGDRHRLGRRSAGHPAARLRRRARESTSSANCLVNFAAGFLFVAIAIGSDGEPLGTQPRVFHSNSFG